MKLLYVNDSSSGKIICWLTQFSSTIGGLFTKFLQLSFFLRIECDLAIKSFIFKSFIQFASSSFFSAFQIEGNRKKIPSEFLNYFHLSSLLLIQREQNFKNDISNTPTGYIHLLPLKPLTHTSYFLLNHLFLPSIIPLINPFAPSVPIWHR